MGDKMNHVGTLALERGNGWRQSRSGEDFDRRAAGGIADIGHCIAPLLEKGGQRGHRPASPDQAMEQDHALTPLSIRATQTAARLVVFLQIHNLLLFVQVGQCRHHPTPLPPKAKKDRLFHRLSAGTAGLVKTR